MGMIDRQSARNAECGLEVTAIYRNATHPESDGGVLVTVTEQERLTPALMEWLAESVTADVTDATLDYLRRRGLTPEVARALRAAVNQPVRQRLEDWERNIEPGLQYRKVGKEKATLRVKLNVASRRNRR